MCVKMYSPKRIKITDVNPHLICVLCGGYYIDATTVIECLHSFCKSCIVKYLEKNKYCPICDVQIHKTTPLLNIRPDKTLQNIVYKLVPSLFKNEMGRRVDFFAKQAPGSPVPALPEQRGEVTDSTPIFLADELLIVCLEMHGAPSPPQSQQQGSGGGRYLHCPAALSVGHLVKLIRCKYELNSSKHQVQIYFKDDLLSEHISLMDVAYTYQCRRKTPIQLTYKILELKVKRIRIINRDPSAVAATVAATTGAGKEEKREVKEWKEVQLQISENGVMSVRNMESCECSPIPAVEAPPVNSPSLPSSTDNHQTPSSDDSSVASPSKSAAAPPPPPPSVATPAGLHRPLPVSETTSLSEMITAPSQLSEVSNPTLKPPPPVTSSHQILSQHPAPVSSSADLTISSDIITSSSSSLAPSTSVTIPSVTVSSSLPEPFTSSLSSTSHTFQTTSSIASSSITFPISSNSISSPIPSPSVSSSSSGKLVTSLPSHIPPASSAPSFFSPMTIHTSCTNPMSLLSHVPSNMISKSTPSVSLTSSQHGLITSSTSVPSALSMSYHAACLSGSPIPSMLPACSSNSNAVVTPSAAVPAVSTMASMKPSTHLVPSNFPPPSPSQLLSSTRPQSEPIVSVSKVSKDQVRKPNNVIEVNKLSISRVPPGGMKEKGENLNKIVNKLSPNERVIGNTSVTIRPVSNTSSPGPPKMYPISRMVNPTSIGKERPAQQIRYKTLKSPTKQWNPSIDRATQMQIMKQNADQTKPARFFKMRNMPRFLGNPASGVKPMYACPEESPNQVKQKLTLMKVDPKSVPTSSIPRSPTKQPPPYTPGSPKLSKPPPAYPDLKTQYMNPRLPSPAHSGSYLPPNPYHLLYSGYPGFSSHEANRMLTPELIRSMCAYHPSLPPSIGMLFNPTMHPAALPRPQENYKAVAEQSTPAVQRIPPSKSDSPSPKPSVEDIKKPQISPGISESIKKSTPTPPPASPKEMNKPPTTPPVTSESKTILISHPEEPPPPPATSTIVKENHVETSSQPHPRGDSDSVKTNCDDVNINNNNESDNATSKESPSTIQKLESEPSKPDT